MPKRLTRQEMTDFNTSIEMPQEEAAAHAEYADSTYKEESLKMPPTTRAFGKKGYEIHVRSGVYYAAYSEFDKADKIIKEYEIPLFSSKSKELKFPYKFVIKKKEKEFAEKEYREIEAAIHS